MIDGKLRRSVYLEIDGSNGKKMIVVTHEGIHVLMDKYQESHPKAAEEFLVKLTQAINESGDMHLKQICQAVMAGSYG